MSADSEPEKYSIDEMMERLKATPIENPEDGELVTRSDGSQAIRVRKRKRRSTQPHKEQTVRTRKARIVQISAALILLILVLLAVGAGVIYANSKPFRDGLVRMIAQTSGATPELTEFRMNPQTANASTLNLDWPAGNALKNLFLRGVSAEIFPTSFLGKALTGEEIVFNQGTLTLQFPKPGEAVRASPAEAAGLPINFKRYRATVFNIKLDPIIGLLNTEASLSSQTSTGLPQLRLYRGELLLRGWPKLRMDRALIEFRGNETDIVGLRLQHESDQRGSIGFSGTVTPFKTEQISSLSVSLDAFPISGIAGPSFGSLISGRVDSISATKSNFLAFKPSDDTSASMEITFGVTPTDTIELEGFPFLLAISQLLDRDEWFKKPKFESDATGVIQREKGVISFRNLNFENKARMAVRGDLSMGANHALSGTLRIGIPETMIPKTSRLQSILSPLESGFRWVDLKIGGTTNAPTDNFKDIYARDEATRQTTPSAPAAEGSTFEELTRPR